LVGEEPEQAAWSQRLLFTTDKIGGATAQDEVHFDFVVIVGLQHAQRNAVAAGKSPGDAVPAGG
jgi:hypothetical protein